MIRHWIVLGLKILKTTLCITVLAYFLTLYSFWIIWTNQQIFQDLAASKRISKCPCCYHQIFCCVSKHCRAILLKDFSQTFSYRPCRAYISSFRVAIVLFSCITWNWILSIVLLLTVSTCGMMRGFLSILIFCLTLNSYYCFVFLVTKTKKNTW